MGPSCQDSAAARLGGAKFGGRRGRGKGVSGDWGGAGRTAGRLDGELSRDAVRAKNGREGWRDGKALARTGGWGCGGRWQRKRKTANFEAKVRETKGSPKERGGRWRGRPRCPGQGRAASATQRMLPAVAPVRHRPRPGGTPTDGPAIARLVALDRGQEEGLTYSAAGRAPVQRIARMKCFSCSLETREPTDAVGDVRRPRSGSITVHPS